MAGETERLQTELAALRASVAEAVEALGALDGSCVIALEALETDATPTTVYLTSRFPIVRDDVFAALDRFSQQLTRVRAEGVRLHVDLEGRSLTDVAALIGRSRQFVTRLYRQASEN